MLPKYLNIKKEYELVRILGISDINLNIYIFIIFSI